MAVLRDRAESRGDLLDPARQRRPDTATSSSTERSKHGGDDTNGDDHVLERHHAVPVRAQTLQSFCSLKIIFQHRRKSFYKTNCCIRRKVELPTAQFVLFGRKVVIC